ncbi:MAG: TolC family protein [Bacteroidales bacterium]|nr:TolC family protein [Bacteroidales bacterium]
MRKRLIVLVVFVLSGSMLFAQQTQSLAALIQRAVAVSPQIKMLEMREKAARENIKVGTQWSDPVVNLGLINVPTNTFSLNQEAMTAKMVSVAQKIPYPGSLKAKMAVKSVDTSIIRQQIGDLKNQIASQVSEWYFGLQETRREIQLSNQSLELLEQIAQVTKKKYEVGSASLQNIIQVEVQKTHLSDKIEALTGKEQDLQAQMNALLLWKEGTTIVTPRVDTILPALFSSDSLVQLAEQNRPALQQIRLYENKAILQQKEARFALLPKFSLKFQYSQRSFNSVTGMNYPDFLGVVAGVTIPIDYGGGKKAKIQRFRYEQSAYEQQYSSSLQILNQHFGKITAQLRSLKTRAELLKSTLLPQAVQAYQAAMNDYQVGKIDFVNVINAENNILNVKTELAKVRSDYYRNMARLEFLSGKKLIQKQTDEK